MRGPSKAASEDPCSRQKLWVFGRRPQDAQTEEHERFQWCVGYTQALPTRRQTTGSLSSLLMRKCRTLVNVVTPSIIGCACALLLATSCTFLTRKGSSSNHKMYFSDYFSHPAHAQMQNNREHVHALALNIARACAMTSVLTSQP